MKTAKTFQNYIERLAAKHGADLSKVGTHLKLTNEPYQDLVIEVPHPRQISVAHYYEQNGDLVPDPDLVCWIEQGVWYPVRFQNSLIHSNAVASWHANGDVLQYYPQQQMDLASFAYTWARNLSRQRWLSQSTLKGDNQ